LTQLRYFVSECEGRYLSIKSFMVYFASLKCVEKYSFVHDIHFNCRNARTILLVKLRGINLMSMNATPRSHMLLFVLCNNSVKYQSELLLLAEKKKSSATGRDS